MSKLINAEVNIPINISKLVKNYVEANKESSGAFIRTFINLIPAILLIIYRKRWKELFDDFNFWLIIALLSILKFIELCILIIFI